MQFRYDKLLLISFLLLFSLYLVEASSSIPYGNYTYQPQNGYFEMYKNGEVVSRFGFAISGIVGGNSYIVPSTNFVWSWSQDGNNYRAYNNVVAFNWTVDLQQQNNKLKITHYLTNNYAAISNTKFWYIQTINKQDKAYFNDDEYNLSVQRHLQGNFNNIIPNIEFPNYYNFDYQDLIDSGFDITDIYVGDGNIIGLNGIQILAIGITKNSGNFPLGAKVTLDPSAITGCTETATTIECHNGNYNGNYIDTTKNISIFNADINGEGSGAENGLVRLNSTEGWVKINEATINCGSESLACGISFYSANDTEIINGSLINLGSPGNADFTTYVNGNLFINSSKIYDGSAGTVGFNFGTNQTLSVLNSNVTPFSSDQSGLFQVVDTRIPNTLIISNSTFDAHGPNGDCASSASPGKSGTITLRNSASGTISNSTFILYGGNGCGYSSNEGAAGGSSTFSALGYYIINGSSSYIIATGGNAGTTGGLQTNGWNGGTSSVQFLNGNITIDTLLNINMNGGSGVTLGGGGSTCTSGSSLLTITNTLFNASAVINKAVGGGCPVNGVSSVTVNNSIGSARAIFRDGNIIGNSISAITGNEFTLNNFVWSGNGYFNITSDDGRVGAFGTSTRSSIDVNYFGTKGLFILNNTQGLDLSGLTYVNRTQPLYYDPINNAPTIIFNGTIPSSVTLGITGVYINITLNDSENDDIEYVNFTLLRPNGTYYLNNVYGDLISGDSHLGEIEEWHSDLFNITNETGSLGQWNWTIDYSDNSSYGQNQQQLGYFTITDSIFPIPTILYPTENLTIYQNVSVDLNFSIIENVELSKCWYSLDNGTTNSSTFICSNTTFTYPAGNYNLTLYMNDTQGNQNYTRVQNITIIKDIISPQTTIVSPSTSETTRTFNVDIDVVELGELQYCQFNITRGASTEIANTQITNCNVIGTTVSSDATYVINIFVNDTSGNTNYTSKTFTVDTSVVTPGGGGGGSSPTPSSTSGWSMTAQGGGTKYQLNMIEGSIKSKDVFFENLGSSSVDITLVCETITGKDSLCPYITFEDKTFTLPLIKNVKTSKSFTITLPQTIKPGEYQFNIVAIDSNGNKGVITTSVDVGNFNFLVEIGTKLTSSKDFNGTKIPYFLIFFLILLIVFVLSRFTIFRNTPGRNPFSLISGIVVGGILLLII